MLSGIRNYSLGLAVPVVSILMLLGGFAIPRTLGERQLSHRQPLNPSPSNSPAAYAGFSSEAGTPSLQLEAEIITVLPRGFEPTEISRPPGPVVLAIYNRSGLEELQLRLQIEVGPRLVDVRVPKRRLDWRGLVNLLPGRYHLTEANHPAWGCTITVSAR